MNHEVKIEQVQVEVPQNQKAEYVQPKLEQHQMYSNVVGASI